MLRVTIELVSAVTGKTSKIGEMHIANTGIGTQTLGNYVARVLRKNSWPNKRGALWNQGSETRTGSVTGYRRHDHVVWRLVLRALRSCYPEEN
jgi:hypothetical protein